MSSGLGGAGVWAYRKASSVFDPTTLVLSGYWRTDYSGAPWAATASAGVSGTTGALTAGNAPSNGTALNSRTPAHFDRTVPSYLSNGTTANGTIWTTSAGTIISLFKVTTAAAATGNVFDDAAIIIDTNADCGMTFTTSGVGGMIYTGSYQLARVACSTGAWHLAMVRWDGANIGITVDSNVESTTAAGTATVMSGTLQIGSGYLLTNSDTIDIAELGTASYKFSNTDYANFKSYVNSRYALSL